MREIPCPHCGLMVPMKGLGGRPPLTIDVIAVCDALKSAGGVGPAARNLGCSRAYIYKVLKQANLDARKVIPNGDGGGRKPRRSSPGAKSR